MFLSSLAQVYHLQSRFSEAEPLYRRSLSIREDLLGAEHPSLADVLGALGHLYQAVTRVAHGAT